MIEYEVLLFAGLRQAAGADKVVVRVAAGQTVGDLLQALAEAVPRLAPLLGPCRVAVDQTFASPDTILSGGEELAVIPPVSGGHDGPPRVRLSDQPLELSAVVASVERPEAGGLVTFTGNVRGHSRGHRIAHLDYEAYAPMALRVMAQIAEDLEQRIPGARVCIHHRVGRLGVGETAVIIAASAPHRAEAFEACRGAIEALKRDVPIWKQEVAVDGTSWFGRGP